MGGLGGELVCHGWRGRGWPVLAVFNYSPPYVRVDNWDGIIDFRRTTLVQGWTASPTIYPINRAAAKLAMPCTRVSRAPNCARRHSRGVFPDLAREDAKGSEPFLARRMAPINKSGEARCGTTKDFPVTFALAGS